MWSQNLPVREVKIPSTRVKRLQRVLTLAEWRQQQQVFSRGSRRHRRRAPPVLRMGRSGWHHQEETAIQRAMSPNTASPPRQVLLRVSPCSQVFLDVGGLVWGSCEASGDSRDAKGCLITAACGVFIRPGSDGVGGAYSYSTRLPLEGEGGALAWGGSHRTCFWHPATGIQPMRHIFWVSAPTSCLVVLLLITPDLPYEQIPPPTFLQK